MLDIKLIREKPGVIKKDLLKRGEREKLKWLKQVLEIDKKWRASLKRLETLRHKRNLLTEEIATLKRQGKPVEAKIREVKQIPEKIKKLKTQNQKYKEKADWFLMRLPNILHKSVPVGKDEEDNVTVRKWGKIPEFDFKPKDHIDLGLGLDLIDVERAAKTTGARFYFLKNELVLLNQALLRFAIDSFVKNGFTPLQPPFMLKRKPYEGVTDIEDFENVMYKVDGEDLYMIATSEHPMISMLMDETIDEDRLPMRFVGISPCFRTEAGSHGKDTKGIFRVHQFDKVELIIFSKPEFSWKEHERLIKNAESIFQALGIPYRIVNVCTGDMGTVAAKKYDLEAWLPAQNRYREMASCSNCTDYQARRLGIKYRPGPGQPPTGFVHTLNSTGVATPRALVAIMENFQQKDGSIKIPKVLWPYMGGMKKIQRKS